MDTIFLNSGKSKACDPCWLVLNLTDKINVKGNKYITLSNLSINYTWKNIKSHIKTIDRKYQLQYGMANSNYLMDHILYLIFNITLSVSSKSVKHILIILQFKYILTKFKVEFYVRCK